jgi:hypothetical protein
MYSHEEISTQFQRERNVKRKNGKSQVGISSISELRFPFGPGGKDTQAMRKLIRRLKSECTTKAYRVSWEAMTDLLEDETNAATGLSDLISHYIKIGRRDEVMDVEINEGGCDSDMTDDLESEETCYFDVATKTVISFVYDLTACTAVYGGLVKKPQKCIQVLTDMLGKYHQTYLSILFTNTVVICST